MFPLPIPNLSITQWIMVGMTVIILGLSGFSWMQGVRIDSLKNDVIVAKTDFKTCTAALDSQNQAITELNVKGEELKQKIADAHLINKEKEKETARLVSLIRSSNVPKDCPGALDHLSNFMKENATSWNSKPQ